MELPIAVKIECAKGEILNALEKIQRQYELPPCVVDGVLSSVLTEVRSEGKIELINATNAMLREKNEEVKKAQEAAKKVLRDESENPEQEEQEEQTKNPEE